MPPHGQRGERERARRIATAYPIQVRLRLEPGCGTTPHAIRLWIESTFRNPADSYMDGHVMIVGLSDGAQARHLAETWAHLLDAHPDLRPPDPSHAPPSVDAAGPDRK